MIHLIVREAFGGYEKGARIEDPEEVQAVLRSGNAGNVITIKAPGPIRPPGTIGIEGR